MISPLASSQNSFTSAATLSSSFQPQCLLPGTFPPDLPCRPLYFILGILCFLEQTRQSPKLRPLCGSSCAKNSLPPDIWMLSQLFPWDLSGILFNFASFPPVPRTLDLLCHLLLSSIEHITFWNTTSFTYLSSLLFVFPSRCELFETRVYWCLFCCSFLCPKCLEQCLAYCSPVINICWMSEWDFTV